MFGLDERKKQDEDIKIVSSVDKIDEADTFLEEASIETILI